MPTYKVNFTLCGDLYESKFENCDDPAAAIELVRMRYRLNHDGDKINSIVQVKRGRNNEVVVPPDSYPHGPFELDPALEAQQSQIVQDALAKSYELSRRDAELEQRASELFVALDDLEEDIRKLSDRIAAARADLEHVRTEEDAVAFDEKYSEFDAGLKYIRVV